MAAAFCFGSDCAGGEVFGMLLCLGGGGNGIASELGLLAASGFTAGGVLGAAPARLDEDSC